MVGLKSDKVIDKINKIDDEDTRVHLKLKLMADIINELDKN